MKVLLLCAILLSLAVSPGLAITAPPDAPKRLYNRVMEEFHHRDYEAALAGFRLFLALHSRSRLASSAQYWTGECEYRLGRFQDAVRSFDEVIARYPQSQKLASATLKKAMAYEKLKMKNEARILFERVIVQFPRSPESKLARAALRR